MFKRSLSLFPKPLSPPQNTFPPPQNPKKTSAPPSRLPRNPTPPNPSPPAPSSPNEHTTTATPNRRTRPLMLNHDGARSSAMLQNYCKCQEKYLHRKDSSEIGNAITVAEERLMKCREIECELIGCRHKLMDVSSDIVKSFQDAVAVCSLKQSRPYWDLNEIVVLVKEEEDKAAVVHYLENFVEFNG